jgi:threonine synthase
MAVELGIGKVAIRSAGNAASALAAYAAAAGIEAWVFVPRDVPPSNYLECRAFGARVTLGDEPPPTPEGWFDLSALNEPYRVEGAKTIGYEIAEQMNWALPDAILYPSASGAGLIGIRKAFEEMEQLGWTVGRQPRMIAVNLAVSTRECVEAGLELATLEGILPAPEGAAVIAALPRLLADDLLKPGEKIVVCNTGAGLERPEIYARRFPRPAAGEHDKLGGLITPR